MGVCQLSKLVKIHTFVVLKNVRLVIHIISAVLFFCQKRLNFLENLIFSLQKNKCFISPGSF